MGELYPGALARVPGEEAFEKQGDTAKAVAC